MPFSLPAAARVRMFSCVRKRSSFEDTLSALYMRELLRECGGSDQESILHSGTASGTSSHKPTAAQ